MENLIKNMNTIMKDNIRLNSMLQNLEAKVNNLQKQNSALKQDIKARDEILTKEISTLKIGADLLTSENFAKRILENKDVASLKSSYQAAHPRSNITGITHIDLLKVMLRFNLILTLGTNPC